MENKKDNSGDYNLGHYNSGHYNSGDCNSGHCNSGHYNSGDYNSGDYNSGDYNLGFFNIDEPTIRMFGKDTGLKRSEVDIPDINLKLNEFINESDMTDQEKEDNPEYKTTEGYLKTIDYKQAWKQAWKELSDKDKEKFLTLPNFDAEIFKEITGINVKILCNLYK